MKSVSMRHFMELVNGGNWHFRVFKESSLQPIIDALGGELDERRGDDYRDISESRRLDDAIKALPQAKKDKYRAAVEYLKERLDLRVRRPRPHLPFALPDDFVLPPPLDPPDGGPRRMGDEEREMLQYTYPNAKMESWWVTAEADTQYNCFAWTMANTASNAAWGISCFDASVEEVLQRYKDSDFEAEVVATAAEANVLGYGQGDKIAHFSVRTDTPWIKGAGESQLLPWSSKHGPLIRTIYEDPEDLKSDSNYNRITYLRVTRRG